MVEWEVKTIPIKLLVLSIASEEGFSPGGICDRLSLEFSCVNRLIKPLESEGLMYREARFRRALVLISVPDQEGSGLLQERTILSNREFDRRLEELG